MWFLKPFMLIGKICRLIRCLINNLTCYHLILWRYFCKLTYLNTLLNWIKLFNEPHWFLALKVNLSVLSRNYKNRLFSIGVFPYLCTLKLIFPLAGILFFFFFLFLIGVLTPYEAVAAAANRDFKKRKHVFS